MKTGYGYILKYRFDAPEIAIWSKQSGGDFLCVEPWWGFSAYDDMPKEISGRRDENIVEKEKTFTLAIEIDNDWLLIILRLGIPHFLVEAVF